VAQHSDRFMN